MQPMQPHKTPSDASWDAQRATHHLKHIFTALTALTALKNTENTENTKNTKNTDNTENTDNTDNTDTANRADKATTTHSAFDTFDTFDAFDAFRLYFADRKRFEFVRTHPFFNEMLRLLKEQAAHYDAQEIPAMTYNQYKMVDTTGSRREFSRPYFERRRMLYTYAVLALLYPEEEAYLHRLEDMIWVICGEYAWCETAHMDGNSLHIIEPGDWRVENGVITPVLRSHAQRVDLFNAETAFSLAEITALLGERLAPLVVNRAVREVMERTLLPFMQCNQYFFWETTDNNWGAVCAGSVGGAAMYLIADPAMLAPILTRCVQTMDCFIDGFTDDGVCPEGLGYWDYGFGFFTCFAELLKRRTGGAVDLFDNEKVRRIAAFQQRAYLSGDQIVSFSDTALHHPFNAGIVHYLRTLFGIETPDPAFMKTRIIEGHAHFSYALRMLTWTNPDYGATIADTYTCLFPEAQWFVCKRNLAGKPFVLAAKGGHNAEPHNHNDVGTFILHFNGVSLLPDIGSGEYTRQYFSEEGRYTYFCNSALGHSVPIINGVSQQTGRAYCATPEAFNDASEAGEAGEAAYFAIDISRAYGLPALTALRRSFRIEDLASIANMADMAELNPCETGCDTGCDAGCDAGCDTGCDTGCNTDRVRGKDAEARSLLRVTLTDEYVFASTPESVTERFVSFIEPVVTAAQTVRIGTTQAQVDITYPIEHMGLTISQTPVVLHNGQTVPVYVLDFAVREPQATACFTFLMDVTF